jgi:molecular chaperone DnaK
METEKITIGIDLGTTFSAVAYVDEHGDAKIIPNDKSERITPSVVYFENEYNVIVGQTAKDEAGLSPDKVIEFVKREMGKKKENVRAEDNYGTPKPYSINGKIYSPEEISAFILKKLKKDAENYFHGMEITDAIITVPAYFNEAEKQATIDAGKMAGLNVLQLINEPTAAAISYGISTADKTQKVFVFDLGGGTFDVSILDVVEKDGNKEINIINTDGDHRLGGKDWDDRIIEYASNEFIKIFGEDPRNNAESYAELRERAEKTKKQLSEKDRAKFPVRTGTNSLTIEITKQQFEEITSDLMTKIEGLCDLVNKDANLTWKEIDTVLLAGGATRMPMVQDLLKRISLKELRTDLINPDECVALGAALQSKIIDIKAGKHPVSQEVLDKLGSIIVADITSHTFGEVVRDGESRKLIVVPMIPKGTKVPSTIVKTFYTEVDNQSGVPITIKEGESTNPENTITIQEGILRIVSPLPAGSPMEYTYSLNVNGLLTVIARDVTNNTSIKVEVERKSSLTKAEVEKGKSNIKNIDVKG